MRDELHRIIDSLAVFSNDPDHRSSCFYIIKRSQVITKISDDALVPIRILSKDVFNDNHNLFNDILCGNFSSNQLL